MPATHPYVPRVSAVFDFDRTLATDTVNALCAAWGIARDEWEKRYVEPLGDDWDDIIKRGFALIECGRDRGDPLTPAFFERAAEEIELYDEVTQLKRRLQVAADEICDEVEVELVVLSSGFVEMIERTGIEDAFAKTWAGSFHFNGDDEAIAVKRIISHPEKALYLEAYAKGLDIHTANEPKTERPHFSPEDMYVPFDQLIYVGDGLSDLDSFGFVTSKGGLAIAIDKSAQFDHADQQTAGQRVENLAAPDYSEGSELLESLRHAVRSATARAALRKLGEGE